ncbi:MAG: DNA recombination protein RmuC, partial [Patescibacteria group bacterium]|nr:DNA recombination protein RmuC [Patescibacteria group bacterium]
VREKLEKDFKMDIKNRIDETARYIQPQKNTSDFALMFIPAEGIYYNMLIYKVGSTGVSAADLIEYAFKKRVIIVSPTSFFAYLQTILHGLKALQMEESVKEIIIRVGELGRHLGSYQEHFDKVGKHLGTTVNAYNSATKELGKIDKDVTRIAGTGVGINVELIDGPQQ